MKMLELFPQVSSELHSKPATVEEMFSDIDNYVHDMSVKPRQTKIIWTEAGPIPDLPDPADRQYWGDRPPLAVFLATGSKRKGAMNARQATGTLAFSGQARNPQELQAHFEKDVPNGNKSFQGRSLINYWKGVPVIMETQDGETMANDDPSREAINKVMHVYQRYRGMNVLVISTDTVDKPSTSSEPLGKPMYRSDFPQGERYEDREEFWAARRDYKEWTHRLPRQVRKQFHDQIHLARPRRNGRDTETLQAAEAAYLDLLKYCYFGAGTVLQHTNAVAILDGLVDRLSIVKTVGLNVEITQERFEVAKPKRDSAGAGIMQDVVDWTQSPEQLMQVGDEFTQQVFTELPPELIPWALYCTITGAPFWQMQELLREAAQQRLQEPPQPPVVKFGSHTHRATRPPAELGFTTVSA